VTGATGALQHGALGGAVSIHAPVTGATQHLSRRAMQPLVSIHAPVTGATVNALSNLQSSLMFQSTRP